MVSEEFSFPIIRSGDNSIHDPTIFLPPLWRLRIINSEADNREFMETKVFRRSFSQVEAQAQIMNTSDHVKDDEEIIKSIQGEEKMDMLWEDFNEELMFQSGTISLFSSSATSSSSVNHYCGNSSCVKVYESKEKYCDDLRLTRVDPRKKKNFHLVAKMMKKLFLIQAIARKRKKVF